MLDTMVLSVDQDGTVVCSVTNGPKVNQFMQTSVPCVFACGNVVHVNDLVDNVSRESKTAGASAALYAQGKLPDAPSGIPCAAGDGIRYVCPQSVVPTPDGACL